MNKMEKELTLDEKVLSLPEEAKNLIYNLCCSNFGSMRNFKEHIDNAIAYVLQGTDAEHGSHLYQLRRISLGLSYLSEKFDKVINCQHDPKIYGNN